MESSVELAGTPLELRRYPLRSNDKLQAWDASDRHLFKWLADNERSPKRPMVINDAFGAIACGLKSQQIYLHSDSKISQLASLRNHDLNQLKHQLTWFDIDQDWPTDIDLVLLKLPKNLNQLDSQLRKLSQCLSHGTKVLIAGKAKLINRNLVDRVKTNIGDAIPTLAWKNTRIIECRFDGEVRKSLPLRRWSVPEFKLSISNYPNVFAGNQLDIGARIILDNFPSGQFKNVCDLGCGNGILGLRAGQLYPQAQIHFFDESAAAIASAKYNWQQNHGNKNGHFHWNDCLANVEANSCDLILCNPPFHQGDTITDHIAWQMINDAKRVLQKHGSLILVGNRHLSYHIKIQRVFGNCETIAANGKFVVLKGLA
ncbi:methyltransferase [Paraferrimonas sp. SM1919]|uniref:methyltransferase n=1 Tax=Paraferrimonas sp. SM1919 TaxID=2662263 RepID=UPI0013D5124C|nr:methyltransferase [Paraferrimonas sp. SM1919]